jgi:MT-A70
VRELIVSPRRKHSQKPDEQYERIERLVDGPYFEMIARQRRPGWTAWGRRTRQVRTRIRRPRRLRQIAGGRLSRHSRARCGRRPEVGAEMTRRNQPEAALQRSVIQHLRWGACGDRWWTHIPTGGRRSPIEAAIFKSLGVRAGSPDLLIIRAGQPLFMELKGPGRQLSSEQVECHAALQRAAAQIATVDNINAALAFLCRLGVLR